MTGLSTLSGGTQSGSGTTIAQGGAAFTSTGFAVDGTRTLQLGGTSTATGTNVQIELNASSSPGSGTLTIGSGATFNDETTSSGLTILASNYGGGDTGATAVMNNQGTFIKSGSAATSTISTTFNNTGTVNVESGTLSLTGGGTTSGAFIISGGAIVQFGSSFSLNGASSSGLGELLLSSGTLTADIDSIFNSAFAQIGGTLTGTGTLTVTGLSTLSGGTQSGSGTTIAQGGAAFTSTGFAVDGTRTLQLGGTSTATGTNVQIELNASSSPGSGTLTIGSGATFNDETTSSGLTILASNYGGGDTGATAVMNNQGTFIKSGSAATSTISTTFNNTGTVNVESGTLILSGGGTDSGASYTGTGTIQFNGGTRTLDAASTITVADAIFNGSTTTINGSFSDPGAIGISAGTLTVAGTPTIGALSQSGGLLNGSGTLTVTGLSTLSGGTQSGSGTTIAQGGAAFTSTGFTIDGTQTLKLGGTSTATGTNVQIELNASSSPGSGTLTIGSGATFNDETTSSGLTILASNYGGGDTGATAVMNNQGTFIKSGSAATSTISTTFNNTGTVNVESGTLILSGGGTDSGASYTGTGTIQFNGGTRTLDAASTITVADAIFNGSTTTINGSFSDPGAIGISAGTLALSGAITSVGTLNQSGGILTSSGTVAVTGLSTLSGGTLSGSGTTIALGGAAFTSTGFTIDGTQTLKLGGTSTATGTSVQIELNGSSSPGSGVLTIDSGATFNDETTGSGLSILASNFGSGDNGSTAVFNNKGTFTKSGSAATSTISTTFNDSGTVNIQSGTLVLSGGGSISGTFNLAVGAFAQFNSNFSLNGGAAFLGGSVSGSGTLTIGSGSQVEFSSSVAGPTIAFSSGSGELRVDNPSTFHSPITGLALGDAIYLQGIAVASANVSGSTLTVTETNSQTLTYTVSGALTQNAFSVLFSSSSGSEIVLLPSTGNHLTGSSGPLSFTPTTAQFYQLSGETISSSTANGLDINATGDGNSADTISVEIDQLSSITVTGAFTGLNISTGGANIAITNAGIISSSAGVGISADSGSGSTAILDYGNVSGSGIGIEAVTTGTGPLTISVEGTATITGATAAQNSRGIVALTSAGSSDITTASGVTVSAAGTGVFVANQGSSVPQADNSTISISSGGTVKSGLGTTTSEPSAILAGYFGGSSPPSSIPNPPLSGIFGSIYVSNSGAIIATTGNGIDAFNYGTGDVSVSNSGSITANAAGTAAGTSPAGYAQIGIIANANGVGNVSVVDAAGTTIASGSNGINALNQATVVPAATPTNVSVNILGAINSGANLSNSGAAPAGMVIGINPGVANAFNANVYGNISVNDFGGINAAAGDGMRVFDYGIGNVAINLGNNATISALNSATASSGNAPYGVGAFNYGPGDIVVATSSGDLISSGSDGINAANQATAITAASDFASCCRCCGDHQFRNDP